MSRVILLSVLCGIAFVQAMFPLQLLAQYPQLIYPLEVGNRWQYVEVPPTYSESRVLSDTTMPNGQIYANVSGASFGGFYRTENSRVYKYDPSIHTESLSYDFSKKTGDTVSIYANGYDSVVVTVYASGSATLFGQQRAYMKFLSRSNRSSIYAIYTITDKIGLTAYQGEVLSLYLAGAVIGGVQYGVISHVPGMNRAGRSDFQLFQNYPNPFNPATTISFSLSTDEEISVTVYDLVGRKVATLLSQYIRAGNYHVRWDASSYPSGSYLCRIIVGTHNATRIMQLIR